MQALTCPKCGAPLQADMRSCPYCRVGFGSDAPGAHSGLADPQPGPAAPEPPRGPAPTPQGWVLHKDYWHGFSIAHPPGWEVAAFQGQISIREDVMGVVSALIWPFVSSTPTSARQVAQQFTALARSVNPSFQIWLQPNVAADSPRLSIKTSEVKYGQQMEGYFNLLVNGTNVIISGYSAPSQVIAQRSPVLTQILSTFGQVEMAPRQMIVEQAEGAYSLAIPQGWTFQGGVNRNNVGGAGTVQFSVKRDPQGMVMSAMPNFLWFYMDAAPSIWGAMPGAAESLPFMTASQYVAKRIVPWMKQFQKDLKVESIVERPDVAELSAQELLKVGYAPNMFDVGCAVLETTNTENGVRLRQKSRINVQRQRGAASAWMASPAMWSASQDVYFRAPDAEFAGWEPILTGILGSLKLNPSWQAGERQLSQNYIQNSQNDIARRQQQISKTLSETSDIVANSYWDRQATYDRISEQRSNAMLGYQNMTTSSGEEYKVPSGYEQYWVNGLGDVYGGSWLTQPDINWQPLDPTGI